MLQPAEEKDNESVGEGGGELDDAVQGAPDKAVEQVEVAANKETADEDGDEDVVHEADTAVEEVEAVLACHAEALTDAVLELVRAPVYSDLTHNQPLFLTCLFLCFIEQVFKYARSKKVEAQSALSSSARGHKVSAPGENSIGGGSGAINTGGRPKKTQKVKLEQPAIIPSYTWRDVLEAVRVDRGESVKVFIQTFFSTSGSSFSITYRN